MRLMPTPSAIAAVNSGSTVAHSEPNAIASTIAAAMKPMNSLGPPPWSWFACWMPEPPNSIFRPSPRASSAVAIIFLYADCGTSTIGCSPSMWTLANATFPSFEICRAAAPLANGLSTRSTCGPSLILASVCSIRAFVAGSFTSSAANTTWFVSVDSVLKFLVRRLRAVVDSVPGSENESVKPDPAPALRPPITNRATSQAARTRNLWRKHQRARVVIAQTGYGTARSGNDRGDRQRAARPRHRDAVVAVADRVGPADGGGGDRRQLHPAVLREPDAGPAAAHARGRPELAVELRRALRLDAARDRVDRDVAHAVAGRAAGAGGVEHAELRALDAAPQHAPRQRGAAARADRLAEGALRLRRGESVFALVVHAGTVAARRLLIDTAFRRAGCGWHPSMGFPRPAGAPREPVPAWRDRGASRGRRA